MVKRWKGKGLGKRRIVFKVISKYFSLYFLKGKKNEDKEDDGERVGKEYYIFGEIFVMVESEKKLWSFLMVV